MVFLCYKGTPTAAYKSQHMNSLPLYLSSPCAERFPNATDSPLTLAATNPYRVMVGGTPHWSHTAVRLNPCRGTSGEAATALHLLQRPYRGRRELDRRNCSASKWPLKHAPGQGTLWQVSKWPWRTEVQLTKFVPSLQESWTEKKGQQRNTCQMLTAIIIFPVYSAHWSQARLLDSVSWSFIIFYKNGTLS